MQVLQLCLSKSWGGLEMSAVRYSQLLAETGIASSCVCLKETSLETACEISGVRVQAISRYKKLWPFTAIRELRKILVDQKADVVFVHHLKDLSVLVPAMRGLKIRLVGFSHVLIKHSKKDPYHQLLYSFLEKMIVFTDVQKSLALDVLPVPEDRYEIIPGFVDTKTFQPSKRSEKFRSSIGVAPNECLLGVIGRLDEQKGQAEFLEALAIVRKRRPELDFKAVFVGAATASEETKGYSQRVTSLMRELGLQDRVRVLGFLNDPSEAMASLDVFVLPSYKETFGLVILEAMASGVAPAVSDAGGPPEIVSDAGLVFAPRNVESLALCLIRLIEDQSLRQRLANSSLSRARSVYSREVVAQQLKRLVNG